MPSNRKLEKRQRRRLRYKSVNRGSSERPRLAVYRSNKHIIAQIIDDAAGRTLVHVATHQKGVTDGLKSTGNIEAAKRVGKALGEKAVSAGIEKVVFDKGGFIYQGRIKALADAARSAGLKF